MIFGKIIIFFRQSPAALKGRGVLVFDQYLEVASERRSSEKKVEFFGKNR
jgi:hypothetical protein